MFFHMYIAQGSGRQPIGDKNFMTAKRPFLFAHMLLQNDLFKIWFYSYSCLSENKTINVCPTDYIVQLSKLTSQWANKYLTLRFNK